MERQNQDSAEPSSPADHSGGVLDARATRQHARLDKPRRILHNQTVMKVWLSVTLVVAALLSVLIMVNMRYFIIVSGLLTAYYAVLKLARMRKAEQLERELD